MFEPFSSGYYLGRFYVHPSSDDRALIQRRHHKRVRDTLYNDSLPLVMKLDDTHMTVHGDVSVPEDTLLVPESVLEQTRIRNPPSLKAVLLAKSEHAKQLLRLSGRTASTGM